MNKIEKLNPLFPLELLESRLRELQNTIPEKQKELEKSPPGELRISTRGNKHVYYFRHEKSYCNGKYLSKPNLILVKKLAQKSYDKKVIKSLFKEKQLLESLLNHYKKCNPENVYSDLSEGRKELVNPVTLPILLYGKKWMPKNYLKNPFGDGNFETDTGLLVRSKSEVFIANMLQKYNIPFAYEYPLFYDEKTLFPDFTCIHPRTHKIIVWEHFGLMNDADYSAKFVEKMYIYRASGFYTGINLISTFETTEHSLTPQIIEDYIKKYFFLDFLTV